MYEVSAQAKTKIFELEKELDAMGTVLKLVPWLGFKSRCSASS